MNISPFLWHFRCPASQKVSGSEADGKVWFQINWQTGAISEHWYTRRVRAYAEHAHFERIQQRIRELHAEQKLDDEIAAALNAEGFRTTKRCPFDNKTIWLLRKRWDCLL